VALTQRTAEAPPQAALTQRTADAVRNPLLSDMAAAGSCSGVWILGDTLEVSRVMGAHVWALTH
jgi:hypothetical protein